MISSLANPNMPPLMAAESQSPGLFALGKANFQESMKDPVKSRLANAMMTQTLSKLGKTFSPGTLNHQATNFDNYGNVIG